jgi:hypothetical protein
MSIIFWDMTPCIQLSFNWRSRGTYRLHLQGRRKKFSKNQQASRWQAEMMFMIEIRSRINYGNTCYCSVQKLLSSYFPKHWRSEYMSVILTVVLYGLEIWSLYMVVVHESTIAIWFEGKHIIHDFIFELHEIAHSVQHKLLNFRNVVFQHPVALL